MVDFSRSSQKYFSRGAKSGGISFYLLETKKTTFFTKVFTGKCKITKSPPVTPFQPHARGDGSG